MSKVIGIDLGTTNSLVALIQNGSPMVLTDVNEKELFPSIVQYKNDGTVVACCESEQDNLLYSNARKQFPRGVRITSIRIVNKQRI